MHLILLSFSSIDIEQHTMPLALVVRENKQLAIEELPVSNSVYHKINIYFSLLSVHLAS